MEAGSAINLVTPMKTQRILLIIGLVSVLVFMLASCSLYRVARETNPNGYEGPNAIQRTWQKIKNP